MPTLDNAYIEGYGYVGVDRQEDYDQVIKRLDLKIKNNEDRVANGAVEISESEINEMIAKETFEKIWKANCSTE
jgi:hypothetical protein